MKVRIIFYSFLILTMSACWNSFDSNKEKKEQTDWSITEQKIYLEKGKQIAATTFTALSKRLQKAIKEGGVPHAIQYCNLAAYPITDSLSQVHHVSIRRTSLKPRNLKNKPIVAERLVLSEFADKKAKGISLTPIVKQLDQQTIAFYAPIMVNDFCLNCHGELGSTLTEENFQLIRKYYPEDKAIGYKSGDLRGMWSIKLAK